MGKLGLQPIRQRQLIDATILALHRHGLGDATVSRIGRAAGMSPAIVHHYFPGKDALLAATMRSLLVELRREVLSALAAAGPTPQRRIDALIDANFAPSQFRPEAMTAWLCFWAAAPHAPALARLRRINEVRLRSNLRGALRGLVPEAQAVRVALGLAAMIDGLFLRCAIGGQGIAPATARALAKDYVVAQLARTAAE